MMLAGKTKVAKEEFYGTKKPRKICDVDFQEEFYGTKNQEKCMMLTSIIQLSQNYLKK